MSPKEFKPTAPGEIVVVEGLDSNSSRLHAFVPHELPPVKTDWQSLVYRELQSATFALGELKGLVVASAEIAPDLLLGPLFRREAVLSSRIEGTTANVEELSQFEADGQRVEEKVPDVREVANYSAALTEGFAALRRQSRLSLTLVRQIHRRLLQGVANNAKPGEFRDGQVFIGSGRGIRNARFVPPPHIHVRELMENLVGFMNAPGPIVPLIAVAMAHYQFETIHPFRDGNGRVGRLLIALQAAHALDLPAPILQMSPYFEANRRDYYDELLALSQTGNWAGWAQYVLNGVEVSALDAASRLGRLRDLHRRYRVQFETSRNSGLTLRFIDLLFRHPAVTATTAAAKLGVSFPTAQKHLARLAEAGVVAEVSGKARDRIYQANEILGVVKEPSDA